MKIYGILSMEEVDTIFSNIESLAGISKEMVSKLKLRLDDWDVETTVIGDVLVEMVSVFDWRSYGCQTYFVH